jgi:hypothetical protein
VLLLAGSYKIVKACADGGWYLNDVSNIAPEAFVADSTYSPFFYSEQFYYDLNYDNNHDKRFNETNVAEWSTYLAHSVDANALKFLLYNANQADLKKITAKITGNEVNLADSLQRYFNKLPAKKAETLNFLQYLNLAKQAEAFSLSDVSYYWDYQPRILPDVATTGKLVSELQKGLSTAKDIFVKQRYWFQLVRYYYFYDPPQAIDCFDKYKDGFKQDNMFFRTMAYAAGAYYKQKKYALANYYYSLIFNGNKQLRTVAHWSFHPQEEADWQQTLELSKSPEEKATLWQMLGIFYKDEMRSMKEIYQLTPNNPSLDLLLTRYLNGYETNGINSLYETPENIETYADSLRATRKQEVQWIFSVAGEGKVSNPFLWNVSAAYLAFLNKDYNTAKQYYDKAGKFINEKDQLAKEQLRLLKLINAVGQLNQITLNQEDAILNDLNWLYFDKTKQAALRTSNAQRWIRETMSKKYAKQGDMQKSEAFLSSSAFYDKDDNIIQYRRFLGQKNNSPYEVFCKKIANIRLEDIYDFLAVRETLQNKDLRKAYDLFVQSGDSIVLLGNPFNGRMTDCHDCDHISPQKIKYTKGAFVQKLILMKSSLENGQDVYNNALLLGNAFYNISFYGNARYFYEGNIYGQGMSYPEAIDFHFRRQLTDNSIAYSYYQKALAAALDDEQRARCLFMMSKCERNVWYNKTLLNFENNNYQYREPTGIDFLEWKSFTELKKYPQTAFYKNAIRECGYFKKVVGKRSN